ncbi:hypothetical protein JOM56_000547 [Amanita muscaria]
MHKWPEYVYLLLGCAEVLCDSSSQTDLEALGPRVFRLLIRNIPPWVSSYVVVYKGRSFAHANGRCLYHINVLPLNLQVIFAMDGAVRDVQNYMPMRSGNTTSEPEAGRPHHLPLFPSIHIRSLISLETLLSPKYTADFFFNERQYFIHCSSADTSPYNPLCIIPPYLRATTSLQLHVPTPALGVAWENLLAIHHSPRFYKRRCTVLNRNLKNPKYGITSLSRRLLICDNDLPITKLRTQVQLRMAHYLASRVARLS